MKNESENESENDENDENKHNLNKYDILIINNGWNNNNEEFIVNIGENSASYKYMHEKISTRFLFFDNTVKLFITITTVILAADSFITIFQTSEGLIIFTKVLTFILAITSIIYNFLNYAKLANEHTHYSNSFGTLYHEIRNIMCLYRKDRPNAIKYIKSIIKQYDHLEVNGPNIPLWQLNDFKKKFKDKISMPEIADKIQRIDIVVEPENPPNIPLSNIDNADNVSNANKIQSISAANFKLNNGNNLKGIQECFKIDGDISEHDKLTDKDIRNLKKNINRRTEYELLRFNS